MFAHRRLGAIGIAIGERAGDSAMLAQGAFALGTVAEQRNARRTVDMRWPSSRLTR